MADRFPLVANSSTSQIQEIPNGDTLDLSGNNVKGVGIITATTFSGNVTGNASGTSGGLSGTPNITVGTVTGTDATFSGNLTVNGTTTTIDTAVTAVDSLAVDGNVAIGTITAGRHLTVSGGASEGAIQITNNTSGHTAANGFELIHFTSGETQLLNRENGAMRFDTNGVERLRIDSNGSAQFTGGSSPSGRNTRISQYGSLLVGTTGEILTNARCSIDAGNGNITSSGTVRVDHSGNAGSDQLARLGNVNNSGNNSAHLFLANGYYVSPTAVDGTGAAAKILADGTIHDSIGPLRRLGIQGASGSFSFAADMAGKLVRSTGNGSTLTIPQNVFSAGDMISVFNVSTGDNTIAQGTGATLYNTADGATGNRTLAAKGVCTIVCTSTNEFIISGNQVS